ncbi:MAG: D-alanyl-D-alanine carboxypeptidase/D-alanyl-D-alanine-endopeptidase (penicillin-binding protein 4) [Halioglobus sp.]|jgi:D-alanyl-D-alanine carboxypeptidase/D-alanyl-D-alanine-endopeptidase (penicillin-binding protein 4)
MNRWLLIYFLAFHCVLGNSQNKEIESKIAATLKSEAFEYASVGISVRSLDGTEVLNIGGGKKLIPASSQKLITTFNAIDILGDDYKFKTRIGYSGTIDRSGTLQGDLVVIGSGDPTVGAKRFGQDWREIVNKIVNAAKKKGINCIDGNIDIRTNVFDGQPIPGSWPYGDVANYYGSGAWAFNFNENEYNLYFKPRIKEGQIAQVEKIDPEIPYLEIESEVITKGNNTGDNAYVYGDQYHYSKIVRGSIPYSTKSFKIRGSIPNPPLSFAVLLSAALEEKGILSNGLSITERPIKKSNFNELLSIKSESLSKIVSAANFESINLYCEALLRLIGKKVKNEGSIDAGLEIISERLESAGIDEYSFRLEDGSGLSPRNNIAPSSFTTFLNIIAQQLGRDKMLKYIPQTGVSGTVSTLLQKKKSQKKFYLKSGSMGSVLSYTGLFQGKSGKWYTICFISNNHSHGNSAVKRKAEDIFELLYLGM